LLLTGAAAVTARAAGPNAEVADAVHKLARRKVLVLMTKDGDTLAYNGSCYGSEASDADLKLLAPLKPPHSVMLGQNNTDAGLDELAALGGVPALHLRGTRITSKGIKTLAGCLTPRRRTYPSGKGESVFPCLGEQGRYRQGLRRGVGRPGVPRTWQP